MALHVELLSSSRPILHNREVASDSVVLLGELKKDDQNTLLITDFIIDVTVTCLRTGVYTGDIKK